MSGNQPKAQQEHGCARCGSPHVVRSRRRNILERLGTIMFLPWRCQDCYHRFYRLRSKHISNPDDGLLGRPLTH